MAKPLGFKDFTTTDRTQSGDDQVAYKSKKNAEERRQTLLPVENSHDHLRRIKLRSPWGVKEAARKFADMDKLKKRAKKQARTMFFKKLTKGADKGKLSFARRQEIEKRLDKMRPKIDKVARKLLPKVRKMEKDRKRGGQNKDD